MKLNEVIAVLQSVKSNATKAKTELYHIIQKPESFLGLSRTYEPVNEEGFVYPPEGYPVKVQAESALLSFQEACRDLFDTSFIQDSANQEAKADIVVNGKVILKDVPVTYMLFLEKQLEDLHTLFNKLPLLDQAEEWEYSTQMGCYTTKPKFTVKTKKITKPVVLYEATQHHPAQVKEASEDIIEGTWRTTKFSSALSPSRVNEMRQKLIALQKAVVIAREKANGMELNPKAYASPTEAVFNYLLEK